MAMENTTNAATVYFRLHCVSSSTDDASLIKLKTDGNVDWFTSRHHGFLSLFHVGGKGELL